MFLELRKENKPRWPMCDGAIHSQGTGIVQRPPEYHEFLHVTGGCTIVPVRMNK